MSVTTSQRMNADQLAAQLPAGAYFTVSAAAAGGTVDPLAQPITKTITVIGATDAQLQTAITAAVAAFVDYPANRATILANARNALAANTTYIGIASPTNAQVTAQVAALTRQVNGLIRFLLGRFDATT